MKKGFLSALIGTLAVLAGAFAAMLITAYIAGVIINSSIKDSATFISLSIPTAAVFLAYFVLFEVLFFKWQFRLSLEAKNSKPSLMASQNDAIISPEKFKKISRVLTIVVICLCLLFPFIYTNTYTQFDGEVITKRALVTKTEYTTDSVNGYSLICNDEGMKFTISMKDGESFEIFNADSLISPKFNEKYESMFGYAAYLSDVYDSREKIVRKKVSGKDKMESTYKESYPEVWKYLEEIIQEDE